MICLDWDFDIPMPAPMQAAITAAAQCLWQHLDLRSEAQVFILVTGPDTLRRVNRQTRGIDTPTDVLSFPTLDLREPLPARSDLSRYRWAIDPQTHRVALGDVLFNVEQALCQAEEYGHSPDRECAYLAVHALLHLLGYDHQHESDRSLMRELEEAAMAAAGLAVTE